MNVSFRVLLIAGILVSTVLGCLYLIQEPLPSRIFSFLSINRPIPAEVLMVEGWLTNRMFKEAAAEYVRGNYSYCLVSGRIYSSLSPAHVFMRHGIDSGAVKFTDTVAVRGHNTYHTALAARQWLQLHDPGVSTINVFTAGPHARKTWTIVKRVLGSGYSVGVIASSVNPEDTGLWWESKQGARAMIKYGVGYLYALLWPFEKE